MALPTQSDFLGLDVVHLAQPFVLVQAPITIGSDLVYLAQPFELSNGTGGGGGGGVTVVTRPQLCTST